MSSSDSEDDSPRDKFSLEVHDKDSLAAFEKGAKDGKRDAKPPMDSALQKESGKISPSIGFNFDFLGPAQGNGGKAPNTDPKDAYTRDRIFDAVTNEDTEDLAGLERYLQTSMKKLTNAEFKDNDTGKTCLIKAMWNLRNGMNDTIPILLKAAKNTDHLKELVNAPYTNDYYYGQTALHIAIEKRNFKLVKLLMENKADLNARASGLFFQQKKKGVSFYFGEFPLSLAACTNQLDIVTYLLSVPHTNFNLNAKDSHGNTVLHALVLVADDTEENTEIITNMYDEILKKSDQIDPRMKLEEECNNDDLTPLKLAAKLGKIELLKHIIRREIEEPEYKHLSRKFTEWTYGPVHTSLYDISSVDTYEPDSVLETIVFRSQAYNRHKMIVLEPLNHLLQEKWDSFAGTIFYLKFILYILYMSIFTATAYHRPLEGQPPFPLKGTAKDNIRVVGEVIIMFGAIYIFICQIFYFWKRRPSLQILMMDGYFEILFFLQATLLLLSGIVYLAGNEVYVALMVFALVIGWVNMLYYTRGFQQTGIYSVMIQKTILRDMLRFLLVYIVFLFGFAAALVTLIGEAPQESANGTAPGEKEEASSSSYSSLYISCLELFKFTIGMGDLQFDENLKFKHFFMFLLILYVVLTYVLLLNMLIALMSETVNRVSSESKSIWKLQRAATILDIERFLPRFIRNKLRCGRLLTVGNTRYGKPDERWCFRVEEMQWGSFGKNQFCINEEPGDKEKAKEKLYKPPKGWSNLISRVQDRAREEEQVPLNSVSTSPSDGEKV